MKIALCLFGLYSGTKHNRKIGDNYGSFEVNKDWYNGELGLKNYINQVCDRYDTDIFIHSWDKNDKEKILNLCKPVSYIIGDGITFKKNKLGLDSKSKLENRLSCFYSRYRVNELRKKYQLKNNIKYDFIIVSRFDLLVYINNLDNIKKDKLYTDFYMPQKIKFPNCLKQNHTKDFWDRKWYPGSFWMSHNTEFINRICDIFIFFKNDYEKYIEYFKNTKFSPHKQYGLFIRKQFKFKNIEIINPSDIMVFIIRYYEEHIGYFIKYLKKKKNKNNDNLDTFVKKYLL
jgi:hypothetical protein